MDKVQQALNKLIPELTHIFGDELQQIVLYGSVARGMQTEESDVDIAVILQGYTPSMHDQMTDLAVDLELEYDLVLSILLIDHSEFQKWEDVLPFFQNVKKDGIILWQAA